MGAWGIGAGSHPGQSVGHAVFVVKLCAPETFSGDLDRHTSTEARPPWKVGLPEEYRRQVRKSPDADRCLDMLERVDLAGYFAIFLLTRRGAAKGAALL